MRGSGSISSRVGGPCGSRRCRTCQGHGRAQPARLRRPAGSRRHRQPSRRRRASTTPCWPCCRSSESGAAKARGAAPEGDYPFGQQIVVSHDGGEYLNWEARSWLLSETGEYEGPALRESGFWRFVNDPDDPAESQAIELLLAHSAGYVELFYGHPLNQSSWELATDALARSKSGVLVGGAKRLYGIVEGGDLAYVEERVDADGGLVPHLSARLSRHVG